MMRMDAVRVALGLFHGDWVGSSVYKLGTASVWTQSALVGTNQLLRIKFAATFHWRKGRQRQSSFSQGRPDVLGEVWHCARRSDIQWRFFLSMTRAKPQFVSWLSDVRLDHWSTGKPSDFIILDLKEDSTEEATYSRSHSLTNHHLDKIKEEKETKAQTGLRFVVCQAWPRQIFQSHNRDLITNACNKLPKKSATACCWSSRLQQHDPNVHDEFQKCWEFLWRDLRKFSSNWHSKLKIGAACQYLGQAGEQLRASLVLSCGVCNCVVISASCCSHQDKILGWEREIS